MIDQQKKRFLSSLAALLAKIAKADGVVTGDEVESIGAIFGVSDHYRIMLAKTHTSMIRYWPMTHWEAIDEIGLDNHGIVTVNDAKGVCNVSAEFCLM